MKKLRFVAVGTLAALALAACSSGGGTGDTTSEPPAETTTGTTETTTPAEQTGDITMWVAGGDTPQELRDWLVAKFAEENPGSTLTIEEQGWGDLVTKLTTALPDAANTPDVVEIGNTQTPTFSTVGALLDVSDIVSEIGADKFHEGLLGVGIVDGKNYALPYYWGSRYAFYRADLYKAAGVEVPKTLAEVTTAAAKLKTATTSGFAMGGADWRNAVSWVFANGGELATVDGTTWTSTLSDPKTITGIEQWADFYKQASNLPSTDRDVAYWDFINDGTDGSAPAAATIMAPGWARWSIGDMVKNDAGEDVRDGMANADKFDIFGIPGVDGGLAPVFAGGSTFAISAKSQHPELAKSLARIILSKDYQELLGTNGLGPGVKDYWASMGDDKFAHMMIDTAAVAKPTPAAPGWAAIEGAFVYEEFFQKVAEGGDVAALTAEYDAKITPMLNGQA